MKASMFDQQHSPTLPVQEGYTAWAATYDEMKAGSLMDYPLLARIQAVAWEQLEAVADLACGTGRTGVWLKEHGVRFIDGVIVGLALLGALALPASRCSPSQTARSAARHGRGRQAALVAMEALLRKPPHSTGGGAAIPMQARRCSRGGQSRKT